MKYKIKFDKRALEQVEQLMRNLEWKWIGERVTEKMLKKAIKGLVKDISKDKDVDVIETGGLSVTRDSEMPELLDVNFKIPIAYPRLDE